MAEWWLNVNPELLLDRDTPGPKGKSSFTTAHGQSKTIPLSFKEGYCKGYNLHNNLTLSQLNKPNLSIFFSRIAIMFDGSLEILNATKNDEGMYTCFAENDRGKANSSGFLTITGQKVCTRVNFDRKCFFNLFLIYLSLHFSPQRQRSSQKHQKTQRWRSVMRLSWAVQLHSTPCWTSLSSGASTSGSSTLTLSGFTMNVSWYAQSFVFPPSGQTLHSSFCLFSSILTSFSPVFASCCSGRRRPRWPENKKCSDLAWRSLQLHCSDSGGQWFCIRWSEGRRSVS